MALGLCLTPLADAREKSKLVDEHWLGHEPESKTVIRHDDWQAVLDIYLTVAQEFDWRVEASVMPAGGFVPARGREHPEVGSLREILGKHHGREEQVNRFAYGAMRDADRTRLDAYVAAMADIRVTALNRDQQYAYWLNLYNALLVQAVLDNYPVRTIHDINTESGIYSAGLYDAPLITVEARILTLNDILHGILRPIWRDERVHYGAVCGAVGCPDLHPVAFTGANFDRELSKAARKFLTHSRAAVVRGVRNQADRLDQDGRLQVSSLYRWYAEDFGQDDLGVIAHMRQFASPRLQAALDRVGEIDRHDFDWSLNRVLE